MPGEPDQIYVDARRALLDALDALGPHHAASRVGAVSRDSRPPTALPERETLGNQEVHLGARVLGEPDAWVVGQTPRQPFAWPSRALEQHGGSLASRAA